MVAPIAIVPPPTAYLARNSSACGIRSGCGIGSEVRDWNRASRGHVGDLRQRCDPDRLLHFEHLCIRTIGAVALVDYQIEPEDPTRTIPNPRARTHLR
jgi:hypothetical protein